MRTTKIKRLSAIVLSVTSALFQGCADAKDIAAPIAGTYAIQNVQTGKNLRPYRARTDEGNVIVLYDHWRWKCLTWQITPVSDGSYHLVNRYTHKTIEPSAEIRPGVSLWQKTLDSSRVQEWEFIKQPDGTYLIRMTGTKLYVTISNEKTNSAIVLLPPAGNDTQRWRLVEQNPWL